MPPSSIRYKQTEPPPQFLAFGEGHLPLVVAASDGAFDRHFSGHFPNITTTAPWGRTCAQGVQRQLVSWLRRGNNPCTQVVLGKDSHTGKEPVTLKMRFAQPVF